MLSDDATTPWKQFNKKKKGPIDQSYLSRLVSVRQVTTSDITTDCLRRFCARERILGMGSKTKKPIVDAIIDRKINPPKELPKMRQNATNRKRFCNVIFCDFIRPKLALRGGPLSKDDLTDGVLTDEFLHREIIKEYNNKQKHNMDVWPTLCLGRSTHPEDFEGPITWQQ